MDVCAEKRADMWVECKMEEREDFEFECVVVAWLSL